MEHIVCPLIINAMRSRQEKDMPCNTIWLSKDVLDKLVAETNSLKHGSFFISCSDLLNPENKYLGMIVKQYPLNNFNIIEIN